MDLTDADVVGILRARLPAEQLARAICIWDRRTLAKGEPVQAGAQSVPMPFTGAVVFIDLAPRANWAHPCLYLLIDKATRNTEIVESRLPPFADSPPPDYVVLLRYGRRPDHSRQYEPYD